MRAAGILVAEGATMAAPSTSAVGTAAICTSELEVPGELVLTGVPASGVGAGAHGSRTPAAGRVSPAYPGWVWMGEPWAWDGAQWVSQDGYWTTADMPQGSPPPAAEPPPEEPPAIEAPEGE